MSIDEKEKILKAIFDVTDTMNESEKNYVLGYIRGFEDKSKIVEDSEYENVS